MDQQNEEKNSEIVTEDSENYESKGWKFWLQDNLRILISVLIVVIIAGGIYSYSKRSEAPTEEQEQAEQSELLERIAGTEDNNQEDAPAEVAPEKKEETKSSPKEDKTSSVATSQETDKSFIETAARGDSYTTLARRALANHLEKNADSSLTAEHKIYIEDYLRKHVPNKGKMLVGTSVEFEKNLIQEAITKSKTLNERQLQNLHKYAVRVPSLS